MTRLARPTILLEQLRDQQPDIPVAHAVGPTGQHTICLDQVLEPKTAKHRVHLDIYLPSIAELQSVGATVVTPQGDREGWTVMADPEGGEFCAFLHAEPPADPEGNEFCAFRPHEVRFASHPPGQGGAARLTTGD